MPESDACTCLDAVFVALVAAVKAAVPCKYESAFRIILFSLPRDHNVDEKVP